MPVRTQRQHSLTQRTGRAVGFRLGGNLVAAMLSLGLGIILARILPPREFGVFGVGLAIVTVADIISSCGMGSALVQRKDLRPEDETTGFLLQLSGSILLGTILVVTGPFVAHFFKMPGLSLLIQLQSVVLLINSIGLIPSTRLSRQLEFDRLAAMDVSSRLLGGLVSIVLGLDGKGALALTAGSLAMAGTRTGLGWFFASGRIPFRFSRTSAKSLLGYGAGIFFIRICNDMSRRVDVFIIGRRLGAEVVGLYQRAYQLMTVPLFQFTNAVNQVLFPAMAKVQNDDEKFQKGFLGSVALSGMVSFPMLTLLWSCADILIPFLYGPRWAGTVPLVTILAFVGYLRVANNPNGLVTQARARVMAEGVRQAAFTGAAALSAFIGSHWGILGATWGVAVATLFYLIFMTRLSLSVAGLSVWLWLRALRTTAGSTVCMSVVILIVKSFVNPHLPALLLLVILSGSGVLAYLVAVRLFLSNQEREILRNVGRILPPRLRWIVRLIAVPPDSVVLQAPGDLAVKEAPGTPVSPK